ncbi:apoptosis-inducing factor 1 [Holotrichia oblita]|uniref:Apoptosis-inducing factor 1 n=1 Tax=Holotrichia oblita TaxID=644536 RepID=A0ACB9TBB3_HOLOL|nr:apoptosis-inducing factor 1 [Holotrichia oblita]
MFRFHRIANFAAKSIRPAIKFTTHDKLETQRYLLITHRFYSNKKKDDKTCRKTEPIKEVDKSKLNPSDCKPRDLKPCKPPESIICDRKPVPSLQECPKPNLMSDMPKPDCAWEAAEARQRQRNRIILLLGALLAALSIGTVFLYLKQKHAPVKEKKIKKKHSTTKKRTAHKIPADAREIPKEVPYLLIGGGTTAFSAFRAIKSADPLAKVLVVSSDGYYPYMRPPLSKEIWYSEDVELTKNLEFKQWNGSQRSLFYEPEDFYTKCKDLLASPNGGVAVARGWSISHIDVVAREAYLENGDVIKYDKCLIATGATPKNLDVFEVAEEEVQDHVTVYRDIYDFEFLNRKLEKVKSVAIIGGGFLGSELACSLAHKMKSNQSLKIYQIFKESGNLGKVLPEYLSFWTTDKVKSLGVEVMSEIEVTAAVPKDGKVRLTLSNGEPLLVDQVIVAVGVKPNTQMAEKSDLEVDPDLDGFLVNTELQARSHLYIAGDSACFYDVKLGRRRVEHHDHAVISGRLAGENMTGAAKPYLHQSMFWSDLGPDVGFEAIGIVDSKLPTVGVFAKATDRDNPKALVTTTDEGLRASSEDEIPDECKKFVSKSAEAQKKTLEKRKALSKPREGDGEDFGKGIIFYLRDDIVVGIMLWNVFNRMQVARQVLQDEKKYDDLNEVAKLFNIHEE